MPIVRLKILPGFMVSDFQKVLLWGPSAEDLELVASCLNPGGFHTEGYCGDFTVFESIARRRGDAAAVVLVWSGEVRDALAAHLFVESVPVAVVDHVYRSEIAEEMFSLGAALYIGKRQLSLFPAALARAVAQRRSTGAFAASGERRNDQFTLTVLHDIANILTGIEGKLKLVGDHSGPAMKSELGILEDTCRSAVDLVRQTLSLSGPGDEAQRTCEAGAIVRQIGSLFRALLPSSVIFEEHLPPPGLLFHLGRPQVIQIALNLLVNARDAVLDRAAASDGQSGYVPHVQLGCQLSSGEHGGSCEYLVLHVRDNGAGMTPEVLQKVFEPGFTTKPAGLGSGLGLLSVREALRRCEGWIDVQSRPGIGTEFLAHVPCSRDRHALGRIDLRDPAPVSGTVLVVEDDELLAVVLRDLFQEMGFHLLLAQDSVSALQLLKESKSKVNLVVSDFAMPGLSGLDLKSLVSSFSPETKFILCSGYGLPDTADLSETLHFIRKPYHTDELIAKVRELLTK